MIAEFGTATLRDDNRAKPSLWLTDEASKRALVEASVFMDAPFGQCRRRYTGRVHIQTFRSIPRLSSSNRLDYVAVIESLDGNQRSTGFSSSGVKVWRTGQYLTLLIFE
jgi:hypothetical protein